MGLCGILQYLVLLVVTQGLTAVLHAVCESAQFQIVLCNLTRVRLGCRSNSGLGLCSCLGRKIATLTLACTDVQA